MRYNSPSDDLINWEITFPPYFFRWASLSKTIPSLRTLVPKIDTLIGV